MDSNMMMLAGQQHHNGIPTKEEKEDSELESYTHDLMGNGALGLSLNEGEDDDDHFNTSREGIHDLPPPSSSSSAFSAYDPLGKGIPQETQPEPTIPRLMQMQMEKYLLYKERRSLIVIID